MCHTCKTQVQCRHLWHVIREEFLKVQPPVERVQFPAARATELGVIGEVATRTNPELTKTFYQLEHANCSQQSSTKLPLYPGIVGN